MTGAPVARREGSLQQEVFRLTNVLNDVLPSDDSDD